MNESYCCSGFSVGTKVGDFTIDTYNPEKGDFGSFSLASQIKKKKWTILFFYPADFTFV